MASLPQGAPRRSSLGSVPRRLRAREWAVAVQAARIADHRREGFPRENHASDWPQLMQIETLPEYRCLRVEHHEPLTWIVLNRPDKANALSNELLEEFSDSLDRLKVH